MTGRIRPFAPQLLKPENFDHYFVDTGVVMIHRYSPGSSSKRKVTQLNPEMTAVAARTRWRNASETYEAVTVNDDCSSASLHRAQPVPEISKSMVRLKWGLTFDMSGGFGLAQPAQRRPLDGVVRCHCSPLGLCATSGGRSNATIGGAYIACHSEPRTTSRQMQGLRLRLRAARACQRRGCACASPARSRLDDVAAGERWARRVTVTAVRHTPHALLRARSSLARGEVKLKLRWDLTSDMSGGFGLAQPAQRRPLDGEVRCLPEGSTGDAAHAAIVLGELRRRQCACSARHS